MAYIIDTYNKYNEWDRAHSLFTFFLNEVQYAIKAVEMEWGIPKLELRADSDSYPHSYHLYESYDDAISFVKHLKHLNN